MHKTFVLNLRPSASPQYSHGDQLSQAPQIHLHRQNATPNCPYHLSSP